MGHPSSRLTIADDEDGGLLLTIAAPGRRWVLVFGPIWLCGWAFGEVAALSGDFRLKGGAVAPEPFRWLWLAAWTAGGLFMMFAVLWNLLGREVVRLGGGRLALRRAIGPLGRERSFALEEVRDLRYAPAVHRPLVRPTESSDANAEVLGVGGGSLAFEAQGRTHRFGIGLDEAESREVIAAIRGRTPDLTTPATGPSWTPPPGTWLAGPAADRITIDDDEVAGFQVTIRAARQPQLIAFLTVWLAFWALGEVMALAGIVGAPAVLLAVLVGFIPVPNNRPRLDLVLGIALGGLGAAAFLLVWLAFWTLAGRLTLFALLWNLAGREVIVLTDRDLLWRGEVPGFRTAATFDLAAIRNLRYAPVAPGALGRPSWRVWETQLTVFGLGPGVVAFDCGGATHRFGLDLAEAEARDLIGRIQGRFKIPDDPEPPPASA